MRGMRKSSMASPDVAAERVLDELRITGAEDLRLLDSIAWERGAIVRYRALRGAEARLAGVGGRAIITISNLVGDVRRRRFGVGHELGHWEMHRHRSSVFLCSSQDLNDWKEHRTDVNLEREANQFAAALLLPERFFGCQCEGEKPSLDLVSELAEAFKTSLTATALRYLRYCNEACVLIFSQDGYLRWFQSSEEYALVREDLGLFIDLQCKPVPTSVAASLFRGRSGRSEPQRVGASAWFVSGRYRDNATVVEQSWSMPQYNAVLTLLWIDSDIEESDDCWEW
jgi:hypothetical protein